MPVAQRPEFYQDFRVMELHSTRCLNQRLNDHGRNLAAILRQELIQFPALLGRIRHLAYKLFRHHAAKHLVHPLFRVANRHTFGAIFDRDLADPALRERYRQMLGDMVVEYLRS